VLALPGQQSGLPAAQVSHNPVDMNGRSCGFEDASLVATYTEQAPKTVPGYHDIHTMASVLLAERAPADARVLVLGAGGGLEVKAFATAHPAWTFLAVDPAIPMLDLAVATLGPLASRMSMHRGYIAGAPDGPFDAATGLLMLHLTEREDRLHTVAEVHRRLRPGAPFVVMHVSYPQGDDAERQLWLNRHVSYLLASGNDPAYVEKASTMLMQHMPALSPDEDRAILEQAGFTGVTQFFSAFTFRGWVGYA
jgi:tRNA (cmo5U34)-methyltransferase